MTAGVPGSGIGGFFYLLSAILMPVKETISICQKKSSRKTRKVVTRQVVNAIGVLCGVWLTGWFISRSFTYVSTSQYFHPKHAQPAMNWFSFTNGLMSLLFVFLLMQTLSVIMRRRNPPSKPDR